MSRSVVVWATGVIGSEVLKLVLDDPELELVGVFVHSPEKDGLDAGDIVGRPKTGVTATTDREQIFALDADIVIHSSLHHGPSAEQNDRDIMTLLRAGTNVISTSAYASPQTHDDPEYVQQFEDACAAGGATLFGSGVDPDMILSRIPAALTGMCADVKRIYLAEIDDVTNITGNTMTQIAHFGEPIEALSLESDGAAYAVWCGQEVVDLTARNLGIELDRVDFVFHVYEATRATHAAGVDIEEGTVCGAKIVFEGIWKDEPFITLDWDFCGQRDHPEFRQMPYETQWIIEVEGTPSFRVVMDVNPSLEPGYTVDKDEVQVAWLAGAVCAVRAIPDSCDAEPGLFKVPIFGAWRPRELAPAEAVSVSTVGV